MSEVIMERVDPLPELYAEMPSVLRAKGEIGACALELYRAGNGQAPAVGDELVLDILNPVPKRRAGDKSEHVTQPLFRGIFEITHVVRSRLITPILEPIRDRSFWDVTMRKTRDLEEADSDRIEPARLMTEGLLS